ncbi:MAG: hypothetical protein KGN79_07960 [Acidobacteriota bacterium]|nr:hypothetical protein [Acidobacteriota bacterium]
MKTAVAIAIVLVVLSSIPLFGQQAAASAQSNVTVNADSARTGQNGLHAPSVPGKSGTASIQRVHGELLGHLDSKNAKTGDKVVVKTTESFKTVDGTIIPKGSKLIGHISQAQALGTSGADARLGLVFDTVELKNKEAFTVHAMIQCIAPSASALAAAQMDRREEMSAMNGSMVGGRPMSAARIGGEPAVGTLNGAAPSATGIASGFRSTPTDQLAGSGTIVARSSEDLDNHIHSGAEASGGLDTPISRLAGVKLEKNTSADESGVLTSSRNNVHLESGTQLTLTVTASPLH